MTIATGLRGCPNLDSQANEAMMRISPLGIFGVKHPSETVGDSAKQYVALTHTNPVYLQANILFTMAIAHAIANKLGKERSILAVVLSCAILTYGGVSLFVVAFAVYPIAAHLFKESGTPKFLVPGSIALGAFTFTMTALPGTPQIQNAIPMPNRLRRADSRYHLRCHDVCARHLVADPSRQEGQCAGRVLR